MPVKRPALNLSGPSSKVIQLMGNKVSARNLMKEINVPIVPGTDGGVQDFAQIKDLVNDMGYPLLIKPANGGGGIGMTVVNQESELEPYWALARKIAISTFGNGELYVEKYLVNPRHIEFQVLGDSHGNVVHLGERECSIQRRHQKLIEESPSPVLNARIAGRNGRQGGQDRPACQI